MQHIYKYYSYYLLLFVSRYYTCCCDSICCAHCIIKECLGCVAEFCIFFCYKYKWSLNFIACIFYSIFWWCYSVYCESLYTVINRSKWRITDCIWIVCNCCDNITCWCKFLSVFTFIFCSCNRFKSITSTASCFSTYKNDVSFISSDITPILNFSCINISNLLNL